MIRSIVFLIALLLCSPAWGQITEEAHATLPEVASCTSDCSLGNVTIAAGSNRIGILQILITAGSAPTLTCTVAGQALAAGPTVATGVVFARDFYILDTNFPAAGSREILCQPSVEAVQMIGNWKQIHGAAQQAPEDTDSGTVSSATSISRSVDVSEGAYITHNVVIQVNRVSSTAATSPAEMMSDHATTSTGRTQSTSKIAGTSAGTVGTAITWTSNANAGSTAMAFAPAPATAAALSEAGSFEGFWPRAFEVQGQTLPDGDEEEAYAGAQFVALNGRLPHTWAVSGGALPTGLSLSAGGTLTGTPNTGEAGTHNFTVEATDADGGLAYRDFSMVVQNPPNPVQQPWERDFTVLRTHYVEASGGCTSGGTCGEIGNPETLAHALGHDQAGDLHILRGGTYTGNSTMSADGTSTNPIIWKCFIDSSGDPENCNVDGSWALSGDWNWVWAMNSEDATIEQAAAAFDLRARGTAFINSRILRYKRGSGLDNFNFGPDIVVYGATLINNGWDNRSSAPRHNTYTANNYNTNGWKYYVQIVSLDQPNCTQCPNPNGPNLFHNNFSPAAGGNGTGYHVQDSTFNNGRIVINQHTSFTTGNPPISRWRYHNNWFDTGLANAYFRIGNHVPAQLQITDSLFRNTRFEDFKYWGALDACFSYFAGEHSIFLRNKIWSPKNGNYMKLSAWNYNASCNRNTLGAAKVRDVDEWDNNTYGPSGTFDINANGSNLTGRTLAQWRTATGDARETGGGVDFDLSSTETALPTTDQVECFDNFYEPGWGYCRAIDWDGNGSITIPAAEAQKIVGNGKTYKVRNERDFRGTPLKTGTYTAGAGIASIALPDDAVNGVLLVWITSQP